jgi:predicted amidophosphoribosyltransferase
MLRFIRLPRIDPVLEMSDEQLARHEAMLEAAERAETLCGRCRRRLDDTVYLCRECADSLEREHSTEPPSSPDSPRASS